MPQTIFLRQGVDTMESLMSALQDAALALPKGTTTQDVYLSTAAHLYDVRVVESRLSDGSTVHDIMLVQRENRAMGAFEEKS